MKLWINIIIAGLIVIFGGFAIRYLLYLIFG